MKNEIVEKRNDIVEVEWDTTGSNNKAPDSNGDLIDKNVINVLRCKTYDECWKAALTMFFAGLCAAASFCYACFFAEGRKVAISTFILSIVIIVYELMALKKERDAVSKVLEGNPDEIRNDVIYSDYQGMDD